MIKVTRRFESGNLNPNLKLYVMLVATYYFRNYQMQLNEMIVRNEDTPECNPEILEELEAVNSKIIETHIR